jgi:hypothetical protein
VRRENQTGARLSNAERSSAATVSTEQQLHDPGARGELHEQQQRRSRGVLM